MESELKPRELTKDCIHRMRKENSGDSKHSGILQVISIRTDNSFMTLSDGHSSTDVALFKSIRPKVETEGIKQNDIIQALMLLHKETIIVLTNFQKVYSDVGKMIGAPVSYEAYQKRDYINPDGDILIPRHFWENPKKKPISSLASSSGQQIQTLAQLKLGDDDIHKISSLTTGSQEFVLKAKVIKKNPVRKFAQGKTEGCVFDIVIADDTDEIQGTLFSAVADKFVDELQVGKIYLFMGGEVRKGGKFNKANNPNEIYFSSKTQIQVCLDSTFNVAVKYKFKKIGEIQNEANWTQVDLAGVVSKVGDRSEIQLKNGEMKEKQVLQVKDDSNFELEVTLWGKIDNQEKLQVGDTVIFTNLSVGEYNKAKVLNSSKGATTITLNPDKTIPRVAEVEKWKEAGHNEDVKLIKNERKQREHLVISIAQLKRDTEFLARETLGKQIYLVSGYVSTFGTSFTYDKCPNADCYKKAGREENGSGEVTAVCPTHGMMTQPPVPKYIGSIRVVDHSDTIFLSYTNDSVGSLIFGCDAQNMKELGEDPEQLKDYLKTRSNLKFTFKVSPKSDSYGGQDRIKYQVHNCFDQIGNRLKLENIILVNTINRLHDNLIN